MIVRIRFPRGRPLRRLPGKNRPLALAASSLLIPLALMAYVVGAWRLAFDIGLARAFPLTGLLAHWQIWIGVAVSLHMIARKLGHYGSRRTGSATQVWMQFPSNPFARSSSEVPYGASPDRSEESDSPSSEVRSNGSYQSVAAGAGGRSRTASRGNPAA